jgi:hypothetical protein
MSRSSRGPRPSVAAIGVAVETSVGGFARQATEGGTVPKPVSFGGLR